MRRTVPCTSHARRYSPYLTLYAICIAVAWAAFVTSALQSPSNVSLLIRAGYDILQTIPLLMCLLFATTVTEKLADLSTMVPRRANVTESTYLSLVFTNSFDGFKVLTITLRRKRVMSLIYVGIIGIVSFTQFVLNNKLAPVIPSPVNGTSGSGFYLGTR